MSSNNEVFFKKNEEDEKKGNEKASNLPEITFFQLFRYATAGELVMLTLGLIFAMAFGIASPASVLIFRKMLNYLMPMDFSKDQVFFLIKWYLILSSIVFVISVLQTVLLNISSKRQARRIRLSYFKALLNQDVSWFDEQTSGALINNLSDKIYDIEQGIGTKLGECVQNLSGFISGILIAYSVDWTVALVASAMLPVIACAFGCFGIFHKYFSVKEKEAYSRASSISGESLSAIRTVFAFGGEKKELERYANELETAERLGIKKATAFGGAGGLIGFSMFMSAALVFWFGIKRIVEGHSDAGSVVTVFLNVVIGSIVLGIAFTHIPYIMTAMVSAKEVFGTIQRVPPIDKNFKGKKSTYFFGNIQFENVSFSYPSRPDVKVLDNFSLRLHPGKTVALVGPSGSGKSTVIHMIQRFYDPTEGKVLVEGMDIRELDLQHFRQNLGCVQQEPVLFEGTVMENIRLGNLAAADDDIVEAAKLANAHEFITELPDAYNTTIGEGGTGLSGGQKQRIAIARALVRKPGLLLLDEATSALDTRSERLVQAALDKASAGRAVLVVAHRLTTVRNADCIVVMDKGRIHEMGTHNQLMALGGLYAAMVKNQNQSTNLEDGMEEEELGELEAQEVQDTTENKQREVDPRENIESTSSTVSLRSASSDKSSKHSEETVNMWIRFKSSPTIRLIRFNRPEVCFLLAGCLCSIMAGASQPIFAILYSEVYNIFTLIDRPDEMQHQINVISAAMAGVGAARLLIGLGQEVGWFDQTENQAGALTALLATEASKLSQITGTRLSSVCETIILIGITLVVAFAYSWQLTLVILAFFPFLALGSFVQMKVYGTKGNEFQDTSSIKIAQEAIKAERTVTSFSLEKHFSEKFENSTVSFMSSQLKQSITFGVVYAFAAVLPTFSFCTTFALGVHLIEKGDIDMLALFRVFIVFSMGSQGLGQVVSATPDAKTAVTSAAKMFEIMDRIPKIMTNVGNVPQSSFKGHVEFKNLHFRYPTRPSIRVLKNFSHTVRPGQTVAIVGSSGCGKSTLIQLLQRFYDPSNRGPESGIFFDEMNLRDLAPSWIRQQIGLVSQEPVLFNMSIRENIAYGDNTREVSTDEIVDAARLANIHDFVTSLPNGYDTLTGEGGSQLSGGQKQRIAIARALIRKPTLLLLDEATSALDTESERLVQAALDAARVSRTSIVIAHRLSTVENSDMIVVIENGRKIEEGSAAELLRAQGAFYALHHAESENQ